MYKKRAGTSGIRGQLYETKLLSLILFRGQNHDKIEDFYLVTNMDEIGAFDDICLKVKIKGFSQPMMVFIQAKHRENDDKVLTLNNKNNLAKYFESFLRIKSKFKLNQQDIFFNGKFDETNCVFVLYTTEQSNFCKMYDSNFADILNDLIATGDLGSQPLYTSDDVDFLCKITMKEEIRMLATRFIKFMFNRNIDMNDDLILRYHVILAEQVVNISDIQHNGHRVATFRFEFFSNKDDFLILFKEKLFEEVLKKHADKVQKNIKEKKFRKLLCSFLSDPTDFQVSRLISENIIKYKNGRFEFSDKLPKSFICELENLPQSLLEEAKLKAVKYILKPVKFPVPAVFGNKDLSLKGSADKIERRLEHLTTKICELLKSTTSKIITINESDLDQGLLQLNGGIASGIGNILIYDENTTLLKFTNNFELLENHSKALLEKIRNKISDLDDFRLDFKIKNMPKLSFEYRDQDLVKEFFSKLVFFTSQEDESGVGNILKQEIDDHEGANTKNFRVKSDAIFLNFHENIQLWWMKQKEAEYLTKNSNLYYKAKQSIINDPMLSVVSMMYMSEIRIAGYTFKESSITFLESINVLSRNIIVTDITKLTFIKLVQSLKLTHYIVLDLKYVSNLSRSDFRELNIELKNINKEKNIIIICDDTLHRNLQDIARAVIDKNIIVITNHILVEMLVKYFPRAKVIIDEGNSLFDLNQESQSKLIDNTTAIFQGQEVSLRLLMDDVSVAFIKGGILNEILLNKTVTIGEPLELPNRPFELLSYDTVRMKYEIKDLYVDRRISRGKTSKSVLKSQVVQTLHDINDDIVLITAKPGMGKSTLLSYLSITTKEREGKVWIMRINLLDYSKEFSMWKKNNIVIDRLEMLKFICQVILKQKIKKDNKVTFFLSEKNGKVYLKEHTMDEQTTFELKLLLHFFEKGDLIFLFDGFDEICPHYRDEVISLLNAIKNYPQKHKMWITSRPYNKIKSILLQNFAIQDPYELEPFSDTEQEIYFEKFWKYNLLLNKFNDAQLNNLKGFINFMAKRHENVFTDNFIRMNKPQNFLLNKIYYHFMLYLQNEIKVLPMDFPLDCNYRDKLNVSARLGKLSQDLYRLDVGERGINDILEFVGTPLHMYLVADYFLCEIKNGNQSTNQWDLDINTYAIYESFLESKLKKIRFQDKNKMDIDNPDIIETYETVRRDFIDMHKKLAAYAIFQTNRQEIFSTENLKEIRSMMDKIERGSEKTGLIDSVSNDIPQFIHMTFTEYFAVEYITDLLKHEKKQEKQKKICDFIVNTLLLEGPSNVLNILDQKLKTDKDFAVIIERYEIYIFNLLMIQSNDLKDVQVKSSLFECISKNLNNFLSIFMSIVEKYMNENNLDNFVKFVAKSGFLKIAAARRYDDLIVRLLILLRNIDISKWRTFISNPQNYCDDIINNINIQRVLRHHFLKYSVLSEVCRLESVMTNNQEA